MPFQTLYQLYIINAGQGFKMLWGTIKSFLDPETASKIHVLGSKYQNKLLEIIEDSELPDFLGGKCKCEEYGGCPKSDKGPWKDPEIIKRVLNGEANYGRQILSVSSIDGKEDCCSESQDLTSHASTSDAAPVIEDGIPVVDNVMDGCIGSRASSTPSTSGLYIVL
ncbi:hypothetical protein PR202_ga09987 [Eleusine coracana subsp. coracana]|uniref:CRAL-TRIO domain-containing protein n=1 Tax=Eleusine coracana subsp. coracana TaxID=191504 RepID=A0AAV5C4X6_ELECO|nr:hypothetical protein PR202_ga09987 [Eleusine coracana subsp. coracana]